ncbi:hypothetical protein ACLESD_37645 [Pyxidicoccus sp. 3LFB2]
MGTRHALLRRVRCLAGEVMVRVVLTPRFEYGAFVPRTRSRPGAPRRWWAGADALWVTTTHPAGGPPRSAARAVEAARG